MERKDIIVRFLNISDNYHILSYFLHKKGMFMRENKFQLSLVRTIKNLLPGAIVFKGPSEYIQGIPDLIILYGPTWAALECKKSEDEPHEPNQDYYVETMNNMSFSRFIFPENTEQVLNDLVSYFRYSEVMNKPFNQIQKDQMFIGDFISQNNYVIAAA